MVVHVTLFRSDFALYQLKWALLVSGLLALPLAGRAQVRAAVRGTVGSGSSPALELATVTLHRATDSVAVKTEFSDKQGAFRLEAVAGRRYRVSVAQVGFGRYWSPAFELPGGVLTLPAIILVPSQAASLKDVTVTARRPLFEHRPDRTIMNVADSPLAAGATTLDVLGRAPGVTVDGDNLGLRGRQGLLLILDGKRVPLTGAELADYLRALPAEQLQSIELITNPPASYDAQGGAGVIAINLKKDQRLGTNGSANASYGRGEYGKFTGGLTLNHRRKNLNAYGNYTYTDRRYFTRIDDERQFVATPSLPAASSVLTNNQVSQLRSHAAKLGLDLNLTKRTLLGVSVTGLASQTQATTTNQTQLYGANGAPADRYASEVAQDINRPSGSANLNLRHPFADSANAATLTADADYARYRTTRLLDLTTYFDAPAQAPTLLTGDQRSTLSIGTARADYSRPLRHRARLEAGAKVTRITSDNEVVFANTANGPRTIDLAISNQFRYEENVNAAYVNLHGSAFKTTLQAGLRAEQSNTLAAPSDAASRTQHYFQLFPSVVAERTLNDRHALALSLTRRIDRPSYVQVNPLRAYLNATSYSAGNPYLMPATSYNFELTHTYRQKFSTALAYARTDQPIVNVVQPSPDGNHLVVNQDVNLRTQHFYTLTLTAPVTLTKWWELYATGFFYYNRFLGQLNGTDLDRGQVACNLTLNSSFTLPKGWSAELNGFYESREVYGFEALRARGQVAAGLQKSLWSQKGTFRLNVADIFYTTPINSTYTFANFTERFYRRQDLRVVTAALTYRFGNSKVAAARKRAAGAEEELRRAAGQ
ncbi:outer membrane beta-barrel protein [Hymenobacter sp. HMF4947]|uniref:Outer membrane beta-barrel protein n=1 Tax=Hymenobacter ginkgonis TaxID=2682976 RepID=A0A7K1TBI8_9BACT|nr:outer membrane beta-barrel protein [Hymenobacter ginkgonis]MVN75743.1 outer membrane beta-barrel protein [Hymenobacter ginkgonis]